MKKLPTFAVVLFAALSLRAELVFGLSTSNVLFTFNSTTPGVQTNIGTLAGLVAGHAPVGMDFRPATGELYLMSHHSSTYAWQLYTVNLTNAALTAVGAGGSFTNAPAFNAYGFDFNPVVDRIRVTRGGTENHRLNPSTGALAATDTSLTWDATSGIVMPPLVTGLAYDANVARDLSTVYGYDYNQDRVARLGGFNGSPSPNTGVLAPPLGMPGIVTSNYNHGMDFSTASGTGYLMANNNFYTFNTNTGAATLLGGITGKQVLDIAVPAPPPVVRNEVIFGVGANNALFSFESARPFTQQVIGTLSGVTAGQVIVGLDFRPLTGELYLMGYDNVTYFGQLYTVNLSNAVATAVGAGFTLTNTSSSTDFGFDFNPTVDRIRVTRGDGLNLRLNPTTGAITALDTGLAWSGGTYTNVPQVAGVAYANNFAGTPTTTLYGYERVQNRLVTINPPNAGLVVDLGASGLAAISGNDISLDISAATAQAYAMVNNKLYLADLNTGALTQLGLILGYTVKDIAVSPLRVTQIARVNGSTTNSDVVITFAGSPGQRYRLQRALNVTGPWADVVTNILGPTNGITLVTNVNGALTTRSFYRVAVQP